MYRFSIATVLLLLAAMPASAHFIWIVPDKQGTTAQVVFSDIPKPDSPKYLDRIAQTQLFLRSEDNKETGLTWTKGKDTYHIHLPPSFPHTVGGICSYGVLMKDDNVPYLVKYYAKACITDAKTAAPKPLPAKAWDRLALEIVQAEGNDLRKFQVLWQGKALAGSEVAFLPPGKDILEKRQTDKDGHFDVGAFKAGVYGFRARHIETKEGVHDGQNYKEIRHYTTLVVELPEGKQEKPPASAFAPLPRAVSSFGADVVDGWIYVYGGHCAKTHEYSTASVLGTFHRLKVTEPKVWEALPSGPALQGLALVAHAGKLYRLGGMQPRNQPGEIADNHSIGTCACFDPATKKWTPLPDLPEARSSHEAVVSGSKVLVFGGHRLNGTGKDTDWPSTVLLLDLAAKPLKWESINQPFQRRALSATVHDGKVYIIGGITNDGEVLLTVSIYDPAKNSWTTGPDLPGPRNNGFSAASCVADGRLYVSVGDGRLLRLSSKNDAWEEAGRLTQPRIVHRMFAANANLLVALGGAINGTNLDSVEALKLQ